MAFQAKTRGACGAAGLGESSFRSRIDSRENSRPEPSAQAQFAALSRLRRQRLVTHLHRLGPAPLFHFLDEIEAGAIIADRLEAYARGIDPEFVRALGGDRFPPALRVIDGGDR
ncbi:MAG TPA: hypothetical protein VGP28_05380 [Methylocella sp.]|jgi:hypothetical protein|nr:hypothetical protein [Methylocella sp.]